MVDLGDSISELGGDGGLLVHFSLDEKSQLFEESEGDAMGVDRVVLVEEVDPFLLLEGAQNELLLFGVAEEEGLAQEGEVQLAGSVDVVEDPIDEQPRGDLVLQGQQLAQVAILAVELIEDQLGLSGQGQKFPLLIPPNLLRAELDLMDHSCRIPPINQQGLFCIGDAQEKSLEDPLRGD